MAIATRQLEVGGRRPRFDGVPGAAPDSRQALRRVLDAAVEAGDLSAADRAAYDELEAAAPVVARLLEAEARLSRLLEHDQREFFLDLLAGRSAECLVVQGRRLGHDVERPHWPLVFRVVETGSDGGSTPLLERLVREAVRGGGPRRPFPPGDVPGGEETLAAPPVPAPAPVVGLDGEAVVAFLPEDGGTSPGAVAERVRTLAARRGVTVLAGWGPPCDDLRSFGTGVDRARWVVDVLAGLPGNAAPAGYDDLGIYALLYEKRDQDQLAAFAERWLGALREHGDLADTLRVLLETGGPSAAATALFVHISTLKYRLRKIESILGVDLSDPEVGFNLRLAFKIRAVRERLIGSPA